MPIRSDVWRAFLPLALFGLAILLCLFFAPRLNPPHPIHSTFLISAGEVSRTIVTSARRPTGRTTYSIRPHHLEFRSSSGPVEVFVQRFLMTDGEESVKKMLQVTAEIRDGQAPADLQAQGSGTAGVIPLHWWPYGRVEYVVYLKAAETSEVELVVHYGPP